MQMKKTFTDKYDNPMEWIRGSGWGSWPENVKPYIEFLQQFLHDYNIKTVTDIGCGDWQFSRLIDWTGIEYCGVDVVESVITQNINLYTQSNITFQCIDVTTHSVPPAELILVKDVLMHWPIETIKTFVKSLLPLCKYVLVTNDYRLNAPINTDTTVGGFQNVDLRDSPYHLDAKEVLTYTLPNPRTNEMETKKVFLLTCDSLNVSLT